MNLGIYRTGLRNRKCTERRRTISTMLVFGDVVTLILAWLVAATQCQRLPTRDEDLFIHQMNNPEIFHDARLIPDGAEVKAYATEAAVSRYFFVVEEDGPPLAMTITPCASPLNWALYLHDTPGEGSASGINDQLDQQRQHIRPSPKRVGTLLKSYTGLNVSTYSSSNSPAGIYMLKVRALYRDSSFMIYATTTPHSDRSYPVLPKNSQVDVIIASWNRISLAWKASVSDTVYLQPIKYCVAVNTKRNYLTLCSIESHLYGDRPPIVPHVGFGFSSEKGRRRSRKKKRKNRRESQASSDLVQYDSDVTLECIGKKTLHTLINLMPNQTYFFDVFAVDTETNRSTHYPSVELVTPVSEEVEKVVLLKDGKVVDFAVHPSRPSKIFQTEVGHKPKELLVTIQPCTDPVNVEIWKESDLVKSEIVNELHSFTVNNAKGRYDIKVSAASTETTHFRIFSTTKPRKYPYPRLPKDTRIQPYRNLRQCTSVTVGWLTSSETAQYCLYKREDTSGKSESDGRKNVRSMNSCHGPEMRKKSEKVLCKKVHASSNHNTVMTETVRDLKQGTDYIFDVYVSRDGKQSLAYTSVKVKTKKYC